RLHVLCVEDESVDSQSTQRRRVMKFSISRTAFVLLGWNSDEAGVKSDEAKAAIKSAREKTSTRGKGASHFFDTTPDVAKEIATCISTQAEPLVKSEVSKEKEA